MTGREIVEGIARGQLPRPAIAELLDIRPGELDDGRASVVMRAEPEGDAPTAAMHGGVVATLLDSAMFFAYMTTLPEGAFGTTLQMNVQFLRPVVLDGSDVVAEGRVVRAGRRVGTVEGSLVDGQGRTCAVATATCLAG
ncbi:MAG TPA: PaaI family thioesterase [Capillimicrobium sp.]|nr:PaaI family thioesterase [Capillimicrobium sp.]